MKRPLALIAGIAIFAGGLVLGTAPAHASADSDGDTTWQTSVQHVSTTWTGSTLTVHYDWDTLSSVFVSGVFTTTANGTAVNAQTVDDIDSGTKTVTVAESSASPVAVTIRADFCLQDASDDTAADTCAGGTVYSATAVRALSAPKGKASAVTLLNALTVRRESHAASYVRTKFTLWVDANGDGETTRAEVLKRQSKRTVSENSHHTVISGRWVSPYDNRLVTQASKLDIDHVVPLEEAWTSGAASWNAKKREAYANDLGYGPSLVAVTLHENRSKGDKEPDQWMPKASSDACTYVKSWIGIKARWHLSIDSAEKAFLTTELGACGKNQFVAKPAKPVIAKLIPRAKKSTGGGSTSGGSSSGGTSSVYYKNCAAVRAAGKAPLYRGQPGYASPRLDRDGDGVACE